MIEMGVFTLRLLLSDACSRKVWLAVLDVVL